MPETYSTPPVWTTAEMSDLLDAAGMATEDRPRYLLPLYLLAPLVKRDIGAIGKSGQMKSTPKEGQPKGPEYKYRSIEDILNEAHSVLIDYGVRWRKVRVLDVSHKASGKAETCVMTVEYLWTGPLGDTETTVAVGEATDFGSDKATNKADTAARKCMLNDWLQLATEDPDHERPDRVDERPQVQPAGIEKFTEVFNSIGPLSDTSKAMVKEYAEAQGISLAKKDWEAMTRADHSKMTAFITARTKADAARPPAPTQPMLAEQAFEAPAPSPLEQVVEQADAEDAPRRDALVETAAAADRVTPEQWNELMAELGKLDDGQKITLKNWWNVQGFTVTAQRLTTEGYTLVLREAKNMQKGSGNAGRQAPTTAPILSPASEKLRRSLIERIGKLPAAMQGDLTAEFVKQTGYIGPDEIDLEKLVVEAPVGKGWDEYLEGTVLSFEGSLVPAATGDGEPEAF